MLRTFLCRNARRLKAMVIVVGTIVFSVGAPAGSIIQINHSCSAQGLGSLAGAVDSGFNSARSTSHTLAFTLTSVSALHIGTIGANAGLSPSFGQRWHASFINCSRSGLSDEGGADSVAMAGLFLGGPHRGENGPAPADATVFTFAIEAEDAALLTGAEFDVNTRVRFQESTGGQSDTVAATVVPLPPAAAMGVVGLIGAAIASRRFNKRSARRNNASSL